MVDSGRPFLADIREQLAALKGDARQMVALRCDLARLEVQAARQSLQRFGVGAAVAAVAGLTTLPLAAVALAEVCDGCWGLSRPGWLGLFALALAATTATVGYCSWRRFRREFKGMQATLAELREDARWLDEWLDRAGKR